MQYNWPSKEKLINLKTYKMRKPSMFLFLMSTSYAFSWSSTQRLFALGICVLCSVHQANCFTRGTIYIYFVFRSPRKMEKRKSKDLRKPFHVLFLSHISSVSVQRNAGEYLLWLFVLDLNCPGLPFGACLGKLIILFFQQVILCIRLKYRFSSRSFCQI